MKRAGALRLCFARRLLVVLLAGVAGGCAAASVERVPEAIPVPEGAYDVWVTSESADVVSRVRFTASGGQVAQRIAVGEMPVEIDGPHGVAVGPEDGFIYVTLGHGSPLGSLWKIAPATEEVVARTPLGLFPATVSVTPDGRFGFVSNFNLHGDHVPSSVSKVDLETMEEVARVSTCVMPHGSRVNPQGTLHYSVCMMDDMLVEIDVAAGEVRRAFSLAPGGEGPADPGAGHAEWGEGGGEICSPTWTEPAADGASVFVTCNRAAEVVEIDVEGWRVARRFPTGEAPYNLAVTPDGRYLLVTLRSGSDPALEVYDLATGAQAGRVAAGSTFVHGVVSSDDSRYAFITVEGVGSERGRVEMIDLQTMARVAAVEVAQQATGIAIVPSRR